MAKIVGWNALKTTADKYVWAAFTPEKAKEIVESWGNDVWTDDKCRDFAAHVIELLQNDLKIRK